MRRALLLALLLICTLYPSFAQRKISNCFPELEDFYNGGSLNHNKVYYTYSNGDVLHSYKQQRGKKEAFVVVTIKGQGVYEGMVTSASGSYLMDYKAFPTNRITYGRMIYDNGEMSPVVYIPLVDWKKYQKDVSGTYEGDIFTSFTLNKDHTGKAIQHEVQKLLSPQRRSGSNWNNRTKTGRLTGGYNIIHEGDLTTSLSWSIKKDGITIKFGNSTKTKSARPEIDVRDMDAVTARLWTAQVQNDRSINQDYERYGEYFDLAMDENLNELLAKRNPGTYLYAVENNHLLLFDILGEPYEMDSYMVFTLKGSGASFVSQGEQMYNGHEYVDLGLASGTMWATTNLSADVSCEYGKEYSVAPPTTEEYILDNRHKAGYKPVNTVGNKDDFARIEWGGNWRKPTFDEMAELMDCCRWETTSKYGIPGYLITGPNDNSIFLPADREFNDIHERVMSYWVDSHYVLQYDKSSKGVEIKDWLTPSAIRPVFTGSITANEKKTRTDNIDTILSKNSIVYFFKWIELDRQSDWWDNCWREYYRARGDWQSIDRAKNRFLGNVKPILDYEIVDIQKRGNTCEATVEYSVEEAKNMFPVFYRTTLITTKVNGYWTVMDSCFDPSTITPVVNETILEIENQMDTLLDRLKVLQDSLRSFNFSDSFKSKMELIIQEQKVDLSYAKKISEYQKDINALQDYISSDELKLAYFSRVLHIRERDEAIREVLEHHPLMEQYSAAYSKLDLELMTASNKTVEQLEQVFSFATNLYLYKKDIDVLSKLKTDKVLANSLKRTVSEYAKRKNEYRSVTSLNSVPSAVKSLQKDRERLSMCFDLDTLLTIIRQKEDNIRKSGVSELSQLFESKAKSFHPQVYLLEKIEETYGNYKDYNNFLDELMCLIPAIPEKKNTILTSGVVKDFVSSFQKQVSAFEKVNLVATESDALDTIRTYISLLDKSIELTQMIQLFEKNDSVIILSNDKLMLKQYKIFKKSCDFSLDEFSTSSINSKIEEVNAYITDQMGFVK